LGLIILIFYFSAALCAPWLTPHDPIKQNLSESIKPPSPDHPLGTDEFGRDVLARLLYGARISILIALSASTIGLLIGASLGLIAGYCGGLWDAMIMRFIDVMLSFPSLILAIAVAAVIGPGLINVMIAVGIYSIPVFARLSRASTQQICAQDYVTAAHSLGASGSRIIVLHVLPNIAPSLFVVWTIRMGLVVLTAAALSFLGLGVQPPAPEWGAILSQSRDYLRLSPQLVYYPGLAIVGLAMGFNLFGDALRDALDPRMRGIIGKRYSPI
jgi:peptide/nickel transport system permease protein